MADYDDMPIYDNLLTGEQLQQLIDNDDYVVASDTHPPHSSNIRVMPMDEAFAKDYIQSDYLNSDIAIAHPKGKYIKDGVRFNLVPFMLHRSFGGF